MSKPTLLDRALRSVAPGWALRRSIARARLEMIEQSREMMQASYEAAERSRTTADWRAGTKSADDAIIPDISTINARARLAGRNDWVARSIEDGYRRHVVGRGIICWSDARDADGELYADFNERANRLFWDQWARRPQRCDIERAKTLVEIQGLMIEEFVEVGESLLIWSYRPQRDYVGLQLQMIEPEQLATDRYIAPNGNEIRYGVEIGEYGEPVAYWIYTRGHPLDSLNAGEPERIPADRVIHFKRQNRVRQSHGVSRLAPVLARMRHLGMFEAYTLVRARLEACIGAVITSQLDADGNVISLGVASQGEVPDSDENEWTFEPGMNPQLPPGRDIKFHTPTTPGTTYEPFTLQQLHGIAAGAGLDFATVAKDYRQGSFISLRMGTLERDREIEPLQQLMIDLVLRPIRDEFITLAILEGKLKIPPGEDFWGDPDSRERLLKGNWRPPAKPPINDAQFYAGAKIAIEQRLRSRTSIIEEITGRPAHEVFDEIDDEQEYTQALGIGLPDAPAERGGTNAQPVHPSEPRPRPARAELNGTANGTLNGTVHRELAAVVGDDMARRLMMEDDE